MNLAQYIQLLGRLSPVKYKIISTLWANGEPDFPRMWVKSSELLTLTQQKYFDRRIREMRDELGCDIETRQIEGEHAYRLNSSTIGSGNKRAYLSNAEKNALFGDAEFRCQVCGDIFAPGVRGLQADHKVPLNRGGGTEISNWQALCNECNVAKRRACAGCKLDCSVCSWAFPESTGRIVALKIPKELMDKIESRVGMNGPRVQAEILRLLEERII